MRLRSILLCAAAGLALCACNPRPQTAKLIPAPSMGQWGFDLSDQDPSVAPGADFYRHADGAGTDRLVIPEDRSRFGSFDTLADLSLQRTRALLETEAAKRGASGEAAKVGGLWRAFMNEGLAESLDAKPMDADLADIKAAPDKAAIARLMGAGQLGFGSMFFAPAIAPDAKDPNAYAVYLGQAGISLPDRDYYLQPQFAAQKAAYQAYIAKTLTAISWPNADKAAADLVDLETQIAKVSWTRAQQRDPVATYNPMSVDDLAKLAPGFDWRAYLGGAELGGVQKVVVGEKSAFPLIADIYAATPLDTLKAWLAFNHADQASPFLSKRFVDAGFDFHSKTLSGQPQQRPRWKRAVSALDGFMGEAIGKLYVADYFPASSKQTMEGLVANLRQALSGRISRVAWMSDATKAKAQDKLSQLGVKIGYPSKWRDYSKLTIKDDDLYGDVERSTAFEWRRQVARLGGPVDKSEWQMTPQTVNAYYDPSYNEIVFPAAILSPPFFDPKADMAVNYGAIGGVIGHEMTHGFDDQGRQFDGHGQLTDWWAPGDAAAFTAAAKKLGLQYSAIEPIKGAHINGDLTMGENIADLGGLLLALDAYHASLGGKPAPVIGGLTGDQRVFLGWAQVWLGKSRDDALRQQLVSDPHSPNTARVNGVVRNIDAWYDAFGVKPGDALYVAAADRVRIW
ncbi:MAG: peptidase [Caulobacteraceae bacterium]|nr:peptidase [Caulobacteraceae bacterium]